MKKPTALTILLLLVPLMTVFVVSNPAGVTIIEDKSIWTASWLQPIAGTQWGWCATVAALMNYVVFALAVVYALLKKDGCLKGIFIFALAASCIAALPIVIQSEVKIIPNVWGVVLLGVECIVARQMQKKASEEKESKPKGERLERH